MAQAAMAVARPSWNHVRGSVSAPGTTSMARFHHKELDVYRTAIELVAGVTVLAEHVPRRRWYLADQLIPSATSVPLNIAEGGGEYSGREKARFYRIARRSAAECSATLDVLVTMNVLERRQAAQPDALLERIASMLTRMVQVVERDDHAPRPRSRSSSRSKE